MLYYFIGFVVVYLAVGCVVTALLSESPWSENSWISTTLLWPLYLFVILFGP